MKRPCVVLARPMSAQDPALAADVHGCLFPEILQGMMTRELASEVVLAVPDYVSAGIQRTLEDWGFALVVGADAPQERLATVMEARGYDACTVLTSYSCLIDGAALETAWQAVTAKSMDAVFADRVIAPKSFAVMNQVGAKQLAKTVPEPLPPFMFRNCLEKGDCCRIIALDGVEPPGEAFLWATLFAGEVAALPVEVFARFVRSRGPDQWFSREEFGRLLAEISGVENLTPLEECLADLGVSGPQLASQVNFLRKLAPHMPEQGERFLEIGCHDQPLLASLAINRFRMGVAVDPFVFSEDGIRRAKALARVLSELAPTLVPVDVARTCRGDFQGLDFYKATVEEMELADASVDFCWSKVVFEHVIDVPALSRELFRVLAPGAAMVHRIDFRDHSRDRDNVYINFDFLRYSREAWARMDQAINLWRVNDFVNLWTSLGFAVEVLERRTRVVRPDAVHPSWKNYTEADLYCYDALIKAVKPAAI